jgi:hypothetical protein
MNSASFAAARIGCRRSAFDHVAAVVQDEDNWRGTRFEKTGDVLVHLVTRLGSLNNDILDLAETDVGRFDQWLSLFMVGSAVTLSLVAILHWAQSPVTGLLVLTFSIALAAAESDARKLCAARKDE